MKQYFNRKKGFTLIEMLVATALFSIVMTISVGSLLSLVDANKKAQSITSVMNNLNFALENISRNMRLGTAFDCGDPGVPLDCTGGDTRLRFTASDGRFIEYRYQNEQLEQAIDIDGPGVIPLGPFVGITAPEVHIENFKFYVTGATPGDLNQPRVVMVIQGYAGVSEKVRTDFNLQTSITQRVLDL